MRVSRRSTPAAGANAGGLTTMVFGSSGAPPVPPDPPAPPGGLVPAVPAAPLPPAPVALVPPEQPCDYESDRQQPSGKKHGGDQPDRRAKVDP